MTHRDRAGDPPGRREAAGDAGHRQGSPTPSGGLPARPEAVSQGFRPGARGVGMRDIRSQSRRRPKALGNRLYGSLSTLLGMCRSVRETWTKNSLVIARKGTGLLCGRPSVN